LILLTLYPFTQGIDTDRSGRITEAELWRVMEGSFTPEQCTDIFKELV
jgi:hypothetical protein